MTENFLQLNNDKTEIILFGKSEERVSIAAHLDTKGLQGKDTDEILGVLIAISVLTTM